MDYIERAISVPSGIGNKQVWLYYTKWYLYSRSENTWESALSFDECSHPILKRFWKSAGVPIPKGHKEPPTGPMEGGHEIHDSTQAYRDTEGAETLRLSRKDDDDEGIDENERTDEDARTEATSGQEETPEPNSDQEGVLEIHDQEIFDMDEQGYNMGERGIESDDEVEALLLTDTLDQCTLEESTSGGPEESAPDSPLFLPEYDTVTISDTYSDILSILSRASSPKPAQVPFDNWQDIFAPMSGASGVFRGVPPLDTIKKRKRPSNASKIPKTPKAAKQISPSKLLEIKYSALRPGNSGPASSFATGKDFKSTTISLRDKETFPFQRQTNSSKGPTRRKVAFITEEYTKPVNANILNHLHELPPGMVRAFPDEPADSIPAPEQANPLDPDDDDDQILAVFDQYIQQDMVTLENFPANPDNDPMNLTC